MGPVPWVGGTALNVAPRPTFGFACRNTVPRPMGVSRVPVRAGQQSSPHRVIPPESALPERLKGPHEGSCLRRQLLHGSGWRSGDQHAERGIVNAVHPPATPQPRPALPGRTPVAPNRCGINSRLDPTRWVMTYWLKSPYINNGLPAAIAASMLDSSCAGRPSKVGGSFCSDGNFSAPLLVSIWRNASAR